MGSIEREFPVTFNDEQKKFIETFSDFTIAVEKQFVEEMNKGKHGWDNIFSLSPMFERMENKVTEIGDDGYAMEDDELEEKFLDIGLYIVFLWNLVRERK